MRFTLTNEVPGIYWLSNEWMLPSKAVDLCQQQCGTHCFWKKTVSCAVKGHLLVDASLNMVITSSALNVDILHLLVADRFS